MSITRDRHPSSAIRAVRVHVGSHLSNEPKPMIRILTGKLPVRTLPDEEALNLASQITDLIQKAKGNTSGKGS